MKASEAPNWRVFSFLRKFIPLFRRRKYLKPALTYDQQVVLLASRGLIIRDTARAIRWLSRTNYYRFSAYLFPFRNSDDTYKSGTDFDFICEIYNFDHRLRLLLMDSIQRIEVWLRTSITYELAHACGPFGYLKKANFGEGFEHKAFLKKLREEHRKSKETFVEHFRKKYDAENDLPIWMATELLTFGTLSHLYGVLRLPLKKKIAASVGVDEKILTGWLHSIGYARNICAHHSRLWNRTLAIKPKCPKRWAYGRTDNSQVYLLILVLVHIMARICPGSGWARRLKELLESYPRIDTTIMGFPPDWQLRAPWNAL